MNILMSFHLFVFGYTSHFSGTEFTYRKKRKKYPAKTSTAHKLARAKAARFYLARTWTERPVTSGEKTTP